MPEHATTVATTTQQALRRAAGRHIALAATIILDAIYATLIISGINFGDDHRLLPAQISQIVVGTLVCATTIASTIVICGRAGERAETAVAELAARFAADLDQLREDLRATLASANIHAVQVDTLMNSLRSRVDRRVDEAVGVKMEEYGNQRFFAGYAASYEDTAKGVVVALQPRSRSSTS